MDRRKFLVGSGAAVGSGIFGNYVFARTELTSAQVLEDDAASEQAPAQLQQLEGEWPKFRYDLANTGFAATETGPKPPVSPRWRFQTGFSVFSSPAVADSTVYVGSDDGNVYALDAQTGTEQWRFQTGNFVNSSPAVADGTVYVGNFDGNVYALDAQTGTEQWRFQAGDGVDSSPAVADGTVYVGSYDGNVYALDAETGTEQWSFQTGDIVWSSPAVADGTVYVGSYDNNVYALDAQTGAEQWTFQTDFFVPTSPAVADGTVYIVSLDTNMYALDAETGTEQWRFQIGVSYFSSPAVADGTVYVGSIDNVYALDAQTGAEQWISQTGANAFSSPAVADGTIYLGNVYALDAQTGTEQWRFQTGSSGPSSPAVADGTVYVGSDDGNVYAIEGEPPEPEASITFADQESDGTSVVIDQVDLSHGGYVEITDAEGSVRGKSAILEAGTHETVEGTLSPVLQETQELTATVYLPTGEPYLGPDGGPVSATALITVVEPVQPTASITFDDQKSDGASVVIQQVELSEGGFVEITDANGVARGQTANLDAGTHENLEVVLTPPLAETQLLTATVYRDIDAPYLENGEPVSAIALIIVHPGEKPPKKKRCKKKLAVKRTKREYKQAKKKFEKGQLSEKELKKKQGAYERAKREYEKYKNRCD